MMRDADSVICFNVRKGVLFCKGTVRPKSSKKALFAREPLQNRAGVARHRESSFPIATSTSAKLVFTPEPSLTLWVVIFLMSEHH